jgi:hypothetical protein
MNMGVVKISKTEYSYNGHNIIVHKTGLADGSDALVHSVDGVGWYATVDGVVCEQSKGSSTKRLAVTYAKAMVDHGS